MGRQLDATTRNWLLKARIHRLPKEYPLDPQSPEYLYLVQQRKRLSLAASVGRLRPRNALLLPFIGTIVLLKAADLWIANLMIRSLINERDLLRLSDQARKPSD